MSGAMLLLTITAILIYCGLLQRVLDRMYLTDKQALWLVVAMLAGTFLPDISLGRLQINIGGFLIPVGVCIYLLLRANQSFERLRAILGSLITGCAVYTASLLLPSEPEKLLLDPMWLYGICGGAIAWLTGRSRRGAFICGVLGVILADVASASVAWIHGTQVRLSLGGAGIADAVVISGVIAVLFCELFGELIERIARTATGRRMP